MKHLTLIIGLLWALSVSGQIYIDSYRFGAAPSANLLLDDYPNAAVAYSLRLLRTAYNGDCIEVRRSSDNTTSNIGFSGNYLDTVTLKTFCASTDCFVKTWYDQSINANNASQTTNASQPRIVNAGVFLNHLNFATSTSMSSTSAVYDALTTYTNFQVTQVTATAVLGATSNGAIFYAAAQNGSTSSTVSSFTLTSYHINGSLLTGTINRDVLFDNTFNSFKLITSIATSGSIGASLVAALGYPSAGNFSNFTQKEVVIYPNSQSSNQSSIESNINSFYNIY